MVFSGRSALKNNPDLQGPGPAMPGRPTKFIDIGWDVWYREVTFFTRHRGVILIYERRVITHFVNTDGAGGRR